MSRKQDMTNIRERIVVRNGTEETHYQVRTQRMTSDEASEVCSIHPALGVHTAVDFRRGRERLLWKRRLAKIDVDVRMVDLTGDIRRNLAEINRAQSFEF